MKSPTLLHSFRFACEGIAHAFTTQRNFKIHAAISAVVLIAGFVLRISSEQWAIVAVTVALVFQAELFNTALEAVVDHVSPEFHALAKVAKDCAAGAVFITAVISVVVGALLFAPPLLALVR